MNRSLQAALCLLFLCLFTTGVFGWNKVGHMTVAGIAFLDLQANDPDTLNEVNTLFRSHKAYNGWRTEYNGASQELKQKVSLEAYVFMRAAAWADDVRGTADHRATWHYINYPVRLPDTVDEQNPLDAVNNAVVAFAAQYEILTDDGLSNPTKAKSMGWIFHIVGDIHQPLHGAALVNDTNFKKGDLGGNRVCVKDLDDEGNPFISNLHSYWDNVVRDGDRSARVNGEYAWADAAYFRNSHKTLNAGDWSSSVGIAPWAKNSAHLALDNAYKFQGTQISFVNSNGENCPNNIAEVVPDEYYGASYKLAGKQMTFAGLRLARILSTAFSS